MGRLRMRKHVSTERFHCKCVVVVRTTGQVAGLSGLAKGDFQRWSQAELVTDENARARSTDGCQILLEKFKFLYFFLFFWSNPFIVSVTSKDINSHLGSCGSIVKTIFYCVAQWDKPLCLVGCEIFYWNCKFWCLFHHILNSKGCFW